MRFQSKRNKQGGADDEVPAELRGQVIERLAREQGDVYGSYEGLLEDGIARELARINLPLSLYTEMYWQIDLHNLFHFLALRMDPHAQYEIREYGRAMAKCAKAVAPLAYEAFEEYTLYGSRFSRRELIVLRKMLKRAGFDADSDIGELTKMSARRQQEFMAKIYDLPPASTEDEIKPVDRGEPGKQD